MKPRLAITIGDPAGVGPELALRTAADDHVQAICVPVIFGDLSVLRQVGSRLNLTLPTGVMNRAEGLQRLSSIDLPTIFDFALLAGDVVAGKVNAATGRASYQYVVDAIDAALGGQVQGIVTGPIQKEAWHLAGIKYPGHTELLTDQTGSSRSCMMLTSDEISCALVTVHVGICDVPGLLSEAKIIETIQLAHAAASARLGRSARVAVCGLNPHAGEGGMFGNDEESRIICPAIEVVRKQGIEIIGPLPADTAFVAAMRKRTDVYVCMYHDQGLIPLKTLAFDDAVNVTLGLPIVRTSVDHGTALDIAWQGKASGTSMKRAVELAVAMIQH